MNGRKAKQDRRVARLKEFVLQAHDRLHKDDVEGCHEIIHAALGSGEIPTDVAPLITHAGFDEAFRALCVSKGVRAAFLLAEPVDDGRTRILSGGDADLSAFIDGLVR